MWHEDDLRVNQRVKAYYESIARGGVGLLVVEPVTVDYPLGARWRQRYRIDDDKYIKGLSELTAVIHKHGCPTFVQFGHAGLKAPTNFTKVQAVGATVLTQEQFPIMVGR
jgi:2,4-dienoyl-CoA reductase-like NADH-dependent reductase (Old Yellow Enzyme family)